MLSAVIVSEQSVLLKAGTTSEFQGVTHRKPKVRFGACNASDISDTHHELAAPLVSARVSAQAPAHGAQAHAGVFV